ncbi:MAG TPA: hypothetical protein VGC97_21900 [Pyrinomonadaceae bacterium]
MSRKSLLPGIFTVFGLVVLTAAAASAQTTAFTYQGRLTAAGTPPTANYDFQFTLYDAGGALIAGQQRLNVSVTDGVFNVSLDFGTGAFTGANRFLEIAVRAAGGGGFTVLAPRQPILSAPYAVKSLSAATADNALQLGGVDSTRFVQQDAGGNVSVAGGLTVTGALSLNTVNAQTQYNLGGQRILGNAGNSNLFAGTGAGASNSGGFNTFVGNLAGNANTTGDANSFFGNTAGFKNTTGASNSFFGAGAGAGNVIGGGNAFFGALSGFNNTASGNSFFGHFAGQANTTGDTNAFFGASTGQQNTTGTNNTFLGGLAGLVNAAGNANTFVGQGAGTNNIESDNSFFGKLSGASNLTGNSNSFFGINTGLINTTGSNNTIIGARANLGANNLTNATALGANAVVSTSNSLVLGNNANVGIGTSAPTSKLTVAGLIETTAGGVKFPDGTTQTTAATSLNAILNQTTPQAGANFNIDGTGAANIFNAQTQYNLGGGRFLSGSDAGGNVFAGFNTGTLNARFNNSFFGNNTGASNTFGSGNSFFGFNAGTSNTNGGLNTFVGTGAGILNTDGGENTFVGAGAGQQNLTGQRNSFFGRGAGTKNTGDGNSFFGTSAGGNTTGGTLNIFAGFEAGIGNTTGSSNVFVGTRTGEFDTTGGNNTFLGAESGRANSNGSGNTFVGYNAQGNIGNTLTNATAVGANAAVLQSNSLVLGSIAGVNNATTDTRVGIGTTVPKAKLDVTGGNILVGSPGQGIVLKSPDGLTCKLLSIDNAGAFVLAAIPCP